MIDKRLMVPSMFGPKEVYTGKGASMVLKYIQASEFLLLSSGTVKGTEPYSKLLKHLEGKKVNEEVVKSASEENVVEIAKRYSGSQVEVIIAVGGGKVLDASKAIRFLMDNPDKDLNALAGLFAFPVLKRKLVLIPTTPATGSEASTNAVIFRGGVKTPYSNKDFLPDMAVLDCGFLQSIPPDKMHQFTADIFGHGFEAYFSKMSNHFAKANVDASLKLLLEAIQELKKSPADSKALEKLQISGYLGGLAAGNAFVGACHALAHAAENMNGRGHGELVLVLTRPCLEWLKEKTKYEEYARFINSYAATGLEQHIDPAAIKGLQDDQWAEMALKDPSIKTSPVKMTKELVVELIQHIRKVRG